MLSPTLGRFLSRDLLSADGTYIVAGAGGYAERIGAMSADPWYYAGNSEHPYVYARNNPARYVDPSGKMSISVLSTNVDAAIACGARDWIKWDFELNKNAPCDGYIVQQIDVRCTVTNCLMRCPDSSPAKPDFTYWEAWFVKENEKLPLDRGEFTDQAFYTTTKNTCGNYSTNGAVKFFCLKTTGDLGRPGRPNPKSGWNVQAAYGSGLCRTGAGDIPSTGAKPKWWDDPEIESASRWFSVVWNCCCKDGDVDFDARPK
jgi:hypothetical protein